MFCRHKFERNKTYVAIKLLLAREALSTYRTCSLLTYHFKISRRLLAARIQISTSKHVAKSKAFQTRINTGAYVFRIEIGLTWFRKPNFEIRTIIWAINNIHRAYVQYCCPNCILQLPAQTLQITLLHSYWGRTFIALINVITLWGKKNWRPLVTTTQQEGMIKCTR